MQQAMDQANTLIELITNYDLDMALPKGIPTLCHMVTKRYSRPDNVFVTNGLANLITVCEVDPMSRPPCTDHFPIITNIQLPQLKASTQVIYNFKNADWTAVRGHPPNPVSIMKSDNHVSTPAPTSIPTPYIPPHRRVHFKIPL